VPYQGADRREIGLSINEGCFAAAENLPGNPALHLTEAFVSPLYRVGAGLELNGVNGAGMPVRSSGVCGETV